MVLAVSIIALPNLKPFKHNVSISQPYHKTKYHLNIMNNRSEDVVEKMIRDKVYIIHLLWCFNYYILVQKYVLTLTVTSGT